jgi:hypothetical protein
MENPLLDQYAREVRYLLHRMDDAERERFGQRVVEDAEAFDRVREAEKELYDAHARNTLPGDLQADFRRVLLHTATQQRRLEVARTLARHPPPRRRTTPIALLALAAGVLLGFAFVPRLLRNNGGPAVLRLSMNQTRAAAAIPEFQVDRGKPVEFRVSWNPAEPGKALGHRSSGTESASGLARLRPAIGNSWCRWVRTC